MELNITEISEKTNLVVDKLMHLGIPGTNSEALNKDSGEAVGIYPRDFGMKEWDWPQGIGLYGLYKLNSYYKDNRYLDFFKEWYQENLELGLPSKNINTTTPLLPLVELLDTFSDKKYEDLCLSWAKWLMRYMPRTEEGAFQHVTSANGDRLGVRLNDSELWIDTMFMTVLFLNKMGHRYNEQEWIEEAVYQVLVHIKYLYDKKTGLFFHGYSFNENSNFGEVFWCRGNSWFTAGILEFLDTFKGSLTPSIKKYFINTYKAQVKALKGYQAESGLWHTVIDDESSYEEVSGTAAITSGIIKGLKMGILDDSYILCAQKAINGILKNIDKDGTVLNVSAGTSMGYSKEHYKNIIIAPMAYGQSLTLLALTEALDFMTIQ